MKFWIGATDPTWYENIKGIAADEANLWKTTDRLAPANVVHGTPFLFRLGSDVSCIVGGGFFVTQSYLPMQLAWDIFGDKNGYPNRQDFTDAIYAQAERPDAHQNIYCTVLANITYFDRVDWIRVSTDGNGDRSPGRLYDASDGEGHQIWKLASPLLANKTQTTGYHPDANPQKAEEERSAYGQERIIRPRLGQSAFRVLVTDAYQRRCAITGEKTLVTLEAAHIVPYAKEQAHDVKNGLLLRADFHRLFDVGLVGISPDLRIRVSPRIREDWYNGKAYYRLDGQPLTVVPEDPETQPDRNRLKWHIENVYQD